MTSPSSRRFGTTPGLEGTRFCLWAPSVDGVELVRPDVPALAMEATGEGFFEAEVAGVVSGERYRFHAAGLDFPDPASRCQEKDAEGWSLVPPTLPPPSDGAIRPWHEAIVAEVHVGAATPEGTFAALARRLDHFVDAGFTVIEIMPVADFVGRWNWGYDGVLPFAPDRSYGTPEDLRALVDAAHERELGVVLDVVYNHFGPAGNFLHHYAGAFFAPDEPTPWGPAIALDEPVVRDFFCQNVQMWLADYDMDGLRFDAVHAFRTRGAPRFLIELAAAARAVKPDAYLILENDENQARWLEREGVQPHLFTAQWNDDFHHVFAVAAGRDVTAHLRDYAADPVGQAGRALAEGFVYQGEVSVHRGTPRGEPSAQLPPTAFVSFVQNHDQIGNRPLGDRLAERISAEKAACLRFVTALSPHVPLYFMGEEALIDTPFPFFCDFPGDLGNAVRRGRREEFRPFFERLDGSPDDLPDPLDPATFLSAKLDWDRLEREPYRAALADFRELLALRRRHVWPLLRSEYRGASIEKSGGALLVEWSFAAGSIAMALRPGEGDGPIDAPGGRPEACIGLCERIDNKVTLGPWSAALWVHGR